MWSNWELTGGWQPFALANGILIAWPDGLNSSWNAGAAWCGAAVEQSTDDVGFIDGVISRMQAMYHVDAGRVYLAGHSCGCAMAQTYAVRRSATVAGMACHAGYMLATPTADYVPTSAWLAFGTFDESSPYAPGRTDEAIAAGYIGAVASLNRWRDANLCSGSPVETWRVGDDYATTYTTCNGGTEVGLLPYSHLPYSHRTMAGCCAELSGPSTRCLWPAACLPTARSDSPVCRTRALAERAARGVVLLPVTAL